MGKKQTPGNIWVLRTTVDNSKKIHTFVSYDGPPSPAYKKYVMDEIPEEYRSFVRDCVWIQKDDLMKYWKGRVITMLQRNYIMGLKDKAMALYRKDTDERGINVRVHPKKR